MPSPDHEHRIGDDHYHAYDDACWVRIKNLSVRLEDMHGHLAVLVCRQGEENSKAVARLDVDFPEVCDD